MPSWTASKSAPHPFNSRKSNDERSIRHGLHPERSIFDALANTAMPYRDLVARLLSRFGEKWSSMSFWRLPPGLELDEVESEDQPDVFLQAAGTAGAMTIEWKKREQNGVTRLYTVGRGGLRTAQTAFAISFNDGEAQTLIYEDEVFAADEATDIFYQYFQTETVPSQYVLRELDPSA